MGAIQANSLKIESIGYRESGREEARALSSSLLSWQSRFNFFFFFSLFFLNSSIFLFRFFFLLQVASALSPTQYLFFYNATFNQALPLLLLLMVDQPPT